MFVKDQLNAVSTVKVTPFGNWRIATGLPPVEGQPNTFRAENFDVLYDSPFEVSDFKEISFDAHGKPHRIVFSGVRDFFWWHKLFDWPVFNVADCCLVCGAGLLVLEVFFARSETTVSSVEQPTDVAVSNVN